MTTTVRMPQWGMGITEGAVLRWLKQAGDAVVEGEVLAEIETCLLYTSPSPRDRTRNRMPSSA